MSKYSIVLNILLLFYIGHVRSQTTQLWGMTGDGGNLTNNIIGNGTVFKIDPNGDGFDTVHAFNGYQGGTPDGNLLLADDGKLYGLTSTGGKNGAGVIFSINPSDNAFTIVYDFDIFHGEEPLGSLVQTGNGILYGTTYAGGLHSQGVIFSFNLVDSAYTDLHDFDFTHGAKPYFATPIIVNNKLYGLTEQGGNGSIGYGVLFSFSIDSNIYTALYNFDGLHGSNPYGSLLQATNGKLYGISHSTSNGGTGVLFSFDTDSLTYKADYIFGHVAYANPYGSLIQIGSNKLYGMTYTGGMFDAGEIFSFDINTDSIIDLYDFDGTTASRPYGSLMQAGNNKLYGMTSQGNFGIGNIFSFDLDSTTYNDIHDFNDSMGSNPLGSLIEITSSGIAPLSPTNYNVFVYPNPGKGQIHVVCTESIDELKVTDLLGQLIYMAQPHQEQFKFQLKNNGMYFVTVKSNTNISTHKLIISK